MRYVLVDAQDNILGIRFFDSPPPPFNQKPWRWIPITTVNEVSFNPNTQVRLPSTYQVVDDVAVENQQARNKTTEELDADKDVKANSAFSPENIALATVCFQLVNAVRNLNSQNAITVNQFKTYLKSLL